jgi:CBS domain-containing protein
MKFLFVYNNKVKLLFVYNNKVIKLYLHCEMSNNLKTVGSLDPAHSVVISESSSVIQCCKLMVMKNTDCVLAVNDEGALSGILTDKVVINYSQDIVYKVVAAGRKPTDTLVSDVMTRDPIAVFSEGKRDEALDIMVSRKIRHLPVIFEEENYIGLLDITKLIFDRMEDLESQMIITQNLLQTIELLEKSSAVNKDKAESMKSKHMIPDMDFVLLTTAQLITHDSEDSVRPNYSIMRCAGIMKTCHVAGVAVGKNQSLTFSRPRWIEGSFNYKGYCTKSYSSATRCGCSYGQRSNGN